MILTEHLNRKDPLPTDYSRVDEMALVLERSEIKRNEEKLGWKVRTVYCVYIYKLGGFVSFSYRYFTEKDIKFPELYIRNLF